MRYIFSTLILFIIIFASCEKDRFIEDSSAKLGFSTDTVFFDTVFSSIGTTTQQLRVYNPHPDKIKVSEIYLAGGSSSVFRLNIDGEKTTRVEDKEIRSKDSLYIFIEATIDPNGGNLPLVVQDSIIFNTNGNFQDIDILAWGQDVHLLNGDVINTTTWNADKPYLIYNNAYIDTAQTLTIEQGTRVYLHWQSSLVVYGTLLVEGTKDNPVVFQGDRLEELYDDIPGQWGTIAILGSSKDNIVRYAEINNAIAGFQLGEFFDNNQAEITIENTIIKNTTAAGIYSFGADLKAYNIVIGKTGSASMALLRGGNYAFYHCTFVNYGNFASNSNDPAVFLSNYFSCSEEVCDTAITFAQDLEKAYFANCIIYGGNENEFDFSTLETYQLNYSFDHCIMKLNEDSFNTDNKELFNAITFNEDPKFVDLDKPDFQLDTLSPAKDMANPEITKIFSVLEKGLEGNSRFMDNAPDLGAYERIE